MMLATVAKPMAFGNSTAEKDSKRNSVAPWVATIGLDPETSEQVKRFTLLQKGVYVGSFRDYSLQQPDLELLLKLRHADVPVCVIDFDRNRELAVRTAITIRQLMRGRANVVAISEESGANLILDAMHAGCSEYLVKPVSDQEFVRALARLQTDSFAASSAASSGKLVAFLGCRGGVGATALAVHLGTFVAQVCNRHTLLVDAHPYLGHVALYLGQDHSEYDYYELVKNIERLDEDLLHGYAIHHCSGVDVLASPHRLNGHVQLSLEAVRQTLDFFARVYDLVILDCPGTISELTLACVARCDELYLVTNPDVAALRDLSRYLERLLHAELSPDKLRIVLNRHSPDAALTVEQIEKAIGHPISITIANNRSELARAVNAGSPVAADRKSEFAMQMKKWATSIAPAVQVPTEARKRRFLLWK